MFSSLLFPPGDEVEKVFEILTETFFRLQQCGDINSLFCLCVQQTRQIFASDRVVICQAAPGQDGLVVAESVAEGWSSLLGHTVYLPQLTHPPAGPQLTLACEAIEQVETSQLESTAIAALRREQVQAYLASPIWSTTLPAEAGEAPLQLWGWLVVHHCRMACTWQRVHQQVLQQIATQLGATLARLQLLDQMASLQRQTAAVIEQTEAKYQQATRACAIGVWDWDLQTNAIFLDPLLKAMLGYQDEEIRNHIDDWVQYVYPEDLPQVMAAATEHLAGRSPEYRVEHRMVHKDGSLRWVLAQGAAQRSPDGTPYRLVGTDIDITDRKQAELDLQASEAFRRQVMNLAPIALYIYDLEREQITYCNAAYEASLGYTLAEIQALGAEFLQAISHPEHRERMEAFDRQVFADREGRVYEFEYPCIRKDGDTIIAYTREVVLSRQADGTPKEILGFGLDITERQAAEAALQQSHALYQSLTAAMPQYLYRKDQAGRITYINPAMARWLKGADVIGKTVYDLFPPDLATQYDADDRYVLETGEILDQVEEHQQYGQPDRIYVQVVKSPVRDGAGNIVGTQGIFWDVTTRQRLEQELQESRDQLAMILDSLHAAVLKFRLSDDLENIVYDYTSPGTAVVFGYAPDMLQDQPLLWRSRILPEDWETVLQPAIYELIAGLPYKTIEYRFQHPDNSVHWIQETASVSRDTQQEQWIFTIVATDISDRKQAELNLQQARMLLQQVLDHLPVGVFAKTADTLQFTLWNPACTQLMGYPRDEVLGRTDDELFAPAQAERCVADDREAIASGQLWERLQEVITTKAGQSRIIHNRKVAVYDAAGQAQLVVGIVEDITARVATETNLRQREEEFRSLAENSPDGILRVDIELRIHYVNPTVERRLGLPQAAILGRRLTELGLSSTSLSIWQTAIAETLQSGQEQPLETQESLPSGEHFFQSRIVPERNPQGQIISLLIVSRDITSLKQAQTALQRRAQQEHSLRLIMQHIRESLDLSAILSRAVREVQRALNADRTLIFQLTSDRVGVIIQEEVRPGYPATQAMQWTDEHFPADCYAFYAQGRGRIVADVTQDQWGACLAEFMQALGVQAKMVAPITQPLADGTVRVWGLLITHACTTQRHWQPDELDLLEQVANQLAIALQQSELHQQLLAVNKELENLSTTDSLTQIANRRRFDDTLAVEWQRAQREQRELALILCDIDYFKQYNDTYGHPAGDECLMAVAQALQHCVNRVTDSVARYGGEEFAIILPHTNLAGAIVVVQNLQTAIADLNITHSSHPTSPRLTLSFGITVTYPQPPDTPAAFVECADQALYQAKRAGRNCYRALPEADAKPEPG